MVSEMGGQFNNALRSSLALRDLFNKAGNLPKTAVDSELQ